MVEETKVAEEEKVVETLNGTSTPQISTELLYAVEFIVTAPDGGQEKYIIKGDKLAELPKKAKIAKEAMTKMGYNIKPPAPAFAQVAPDKPAGEAKKQWFNANDVKWDGDSPLCPVHGTPMRQAENKTKWGKTRWFCTQKRDPVADGDYCNRQVTK